MTQDWIRVSGVLQLKASEPLSINEMAAQYVVDQVVRDTLFGTFEKLPEFWSDKWEVAPERLATTLSVRESVHRGDVFDFEIGLSPDSFPIDQGGIQHLIGVLAGDLFARR
jgi:hypothetical protein